MTSTLGIKKIQYPNGTDILTLDSSGSLAIADSATVGGTLDITGNVGLGGANTSSYLQGVVGGKTATIGDASQASSTLVLKDDDGVFDIATTGGTFRIYDDNNERLRIHSSGALTISSQPFVHFQGNSNGNTDMENNDRFGSTDDGNPAFNTAPQKGGIQGITYTSATGRFTVPTAGRYLIFFQGYYNGGAAQCRVGTYVNGVHLAMDHNNSVVGTLQMHLLINCSANDYIEFKQIVGNTQAWYQGIAHMLGYIVMLN